MADNGFVWMVGGPQGSGVDSAARLFAQTTARGGLHVIGQREYYSNIKGKHSYTKIRLNADPIRSSLDEVHFLATYDNETICRHVQDYRAIVQGGGVLFDPAGTDETVADIRFMDKRVKEDIAEAFGRPADEIAIQDILEKAEQEGIRLYPFPYEELQKSIADELGMEDHFKLQILKNTMATAASMAMMEFDLEYLNKTLEEIFADKKESIIKMNKVAARHSADYMREQFEAADFTISGVETDEDRIFLQGTDAVALGKMVAGCRFQTYYPISPATDESVYLESKPDSGVVVIQTEDEIAALNMAIGGALTGARTATSTSGPGFNHMIEGLGFAGICEVPIVVVDYQRGGPSTGLPTRTEQGDLAFALTAGNGEFPRIVLAPGDLEEMFFDTIDAFNFAERYQTPVILLPDKDLAGNSSTVTRFDPSQARVDRGKLLDESAIQPSADGRFPRYAPSEDGISPRTVLGQKGGIHWLTSDEHVEVGHITEDVVKREAIMEKRMRKLVTAAEEIPSERKARLFGPESAELTIVSWGTPKGAILDAMDQLNKEGDKLNFLQVRVLSPFPTEEVTEVLNHANRSVCLENNYTGQLASVIRQHTGIKVDHRAVKYNGRPITMDEVVETVDAALKKAPERIVLRKGI